MIKLKKIATKQMKKMPYVLKFITQILTYQQTKNKLDLMIYFTTSTLLSAKLKRRKHSCSPHEPDDTLGISLFCSRASSQDDYLPGFIA